MSDNITIFEKILTGDIPCKKVYEDDFTFAFYDITPKAPIHVLVIPKIKIVNVAASTEKDIEILGRILNTARLVAELLGIHESGYRLVMNNNRDGGQSVDYLHCHILGGRPLGWPPG